MKRRKEINDNLVKWIVDKVNTEYANDVSLVLIYGSYVNGTANSKSDIDCYYIPKSERGNHGGYIKQYDSFEQFVSAKL